MADINTKARSNFFTVKHSNEFKWAMKELSVNVSFQNQKVSVSSANGWPSEDKDGNEIDFIDIVSTHLHDNEVAIFMESGSEGLRSIHGSAIAVNNKGGTKTISLDDIYKVAGELGDNVTKAYS